MRQGPHKNRSRSRGRRPTGGNQSGRVYESNGPDVKVRGTAQTVADKYLQLARDAHSAGDTVMAEGYFQHAEHYLRIVAASQPVPQQNAPQRRDDYSYDDDDEGDDNQPMPAASRTDHGGNGERQPHSQSQQQFEPQPQQPAASEASDRESTAQSGEQDGDQPWGGPEPEFLRRGPDNGSTRSRRPRQPRKSNGRKDAAASSDEKGSSGDSTPGQDTTEQA